MKPNLDYFYVRSLVINLDHIEETCVRYVKDLDQSKTDSSVDLWSYKALALANRKAMIGVDVRNLVNMGFNTVDEARAWLGERDK